jgi:hypothetical protein
VLGLFDKFVLLQFKIYRFLNGDHLSVLETTNMASGLPEQEMINKRGG